MPLPTEAELQKLTLLATQAGSGWTCIRTSGLACAAWPCRQEGTHLWIDTRGQCTQRCGHHPPEGRALSGEEAELP